MDTDSFGMSIKTNDFYKDIANDVEKRFDTSNYEVNRPLPTGIRPKTYSYLTDDGKEDKKAKGTKKFIIKRMIKFDEYKNCSLKDKVLLKLQQRFISKKHDVYTENINKIH